jgi:hypothetical protein
MDNYFWVTTSTFKPGSRKQFEQARRPAESARSLEPRSLYSMPGSRNSAGDGDARHGRREVRVERAERVLPLDDRPVADDAAVLLGRALSS